MKHAVTLLALAAVTTTASAFDMSNSYVGVQGDYLAVPDSKIKDVVDKGYGLDVIYGDRSLKALPIGYEAHLFADEYKIKSSFGGGSVKRTGLGLDATYPFPMGSGLTPFVLGGLGISQLKDPSDSETKSFLEAGGGLVWALPSSTNWSARGDLRYVITQTDPSLKDLWAKIGIEYAFGGAQPAAAKPADDINVVPAGEKPMEPAPAAEPAPAPAAEPSPAPSAAPRKVISLKGVSFGSNSDELKPESTAVLDEAAKTLNGSDSDSKVEVAGHTDNSGDPEHNKDLSQRRAKAVMDYLVQQGVDAKRLSAVGYGSEQPIADNNTKAGRAKNRRVELRVM